MSKTETKSMEALWPPDIRAMVNNVMFLCDHIVYKKIKMLGSANYLGSDECRQIKEVKALCANLYKYSPTPIGKTREIHHLFFYAGHAEVKSAARQIKENRQARREYLENLVKKISKKRGGDKNRQKAKTAIEARDGTNST